jgi:hypothetical protein
LHRIAMQDIRITRLSRHRQTPMLRIEASFDLSFFIGSADVPGRARELVEALAKEKNRRLFCARRAVSGLSGIFRSATSSGRWGTKQRTFRARAGGLI